MLRALSPSDAPSLQHHADDPASRQRFLLEAEITGGLEHPGIVPVYGLGQYADGRPFYGGTYFPPAERWGKPGFRDLLLEMARLWREERGA